MIYNKIKKEIESFGFNVVSHDFERPWGGFLVIDETQAQDFSNKFFEGLDVNTLKIGGKLSPKILIVKPESRLSFPNLLNRSINTSATASLFGFSPI
jgi:hypothetical protein